jgi:hypothetical protein
MCSGGLPTRSGTVIAKIGSMPAEKPVTATVELVLEPDGVHGTLRAQHTPDLPFSGWLGLAVAVDQCRRAAAADSETPATG